MYCYGKVEDMVTAKAEETELVIPVLPQRESSADYSDKLSIPLPH